MADVLLRFKGDATGALRASRQTEGALGRVQGRTGRLGRSLKLLGLAYGSTLVAGIAGAVKTSASFEKILDQVAAVSGATEKQLASLKEESLDLGAKTKFSAREAAQAEVELAKAGLSTADILGGALQGSLTLAAAGNLELADAATFAANAMNLFGLKGKDVASIADGLATAANTTTADVEDFGRALTQGGASAKAAGLDFQDTLVILEALAEAGVKNSDAGTSMKAALIQLINPTAKQAKAAKDLGLNFLTANGTLKDATDISAMLREKTEGLTKAERLKLLATIAGTDGVRTLLALYDAGPKKLDKYRRGLDDVGSAERVAAEMNDNLSGKLEQLGGAVETFAIRIGDKLIPMVTTGVEKLTDLLTFLGDVAAAPSPELAVKVLFTGVRGAVGGLVDSLRAALFGEVKPIKLDTARIVGFEKTEGLVEKLQDAITNALDGVEWDKTGRKIGAAIGGAIVFTADALDNLLSGIESWVGAHIGDLAELGVQIVATMFVKILDPAFWVEHWQLALALALNALLLVLAPETWIARLTPRFLRIFLEPLGKVLVAVGGFIARLAGDLLRGIGGKAGAAAARGAAQLVLRLLTYIRTIPARVERYLAITATVIGARIRGWIVAGGRLAAQLVLAILRPLGSLAAKVGGKIGDALGAIRRVITRIIRIVYDDATRIGSAIINGIIDGLGGLFSRVAGALKDKIGGAINWAKDHIGSTAEEYAARQLGEPIARGVAGGFAGEAGSLPAAFARALRRAVGNTRLPSLGLPGGLAGAGAGGGGGSTVYAPVVHVHVGGSVIAERDLAYTVAKELQRAGRNGMRFGFR